MAEALTALAGLATLVQMAIAAGMKAKSHKHNVQALIRRLKLLPPLIEEVRASRTPLTAAQLNVFENLEHAMTRAKELLTKCSENSKLYMIFRGESIVQKFQDVGLDLDRCLSALPLVQLSVSDDTREKIEEVSVALREAKFKVDAVDQNLSLKIAEALKEQRETQKANEELLHSLATQLELTTVQASRAEEKGLLRDRDEARAEKERGEEAYINQIIHLLDTLELADSSPPRECPKSPVVSPPDEFRCPVSLELMVDPVILDSGHTFERAYIQKWLDDGHRTCPISRKPLTTLKLIPNQTLKGMIISWCEKNHVPLPKLPVLMLEPIDVEEEENEEQLEAEGIPLKGFKGLRFNTDFSGSSAEWDAYEAEERGSKKRRGNSKFEEEPSRFSGNQSGLSGLLSKPSRTSKVNELVRGVEATQQRLMLYNIETEEENGAAIEEGLRFGAEGTSQSAAALQKNSGQLSDGFSALDDLYNSGSLKLGDADTYSNFDIRDIMCESPLRDEAMLMSPPAMGPGGPLDPEAVITIEDGPLEFREENGSQEEPKFKLSWAKKSPDRFSMFANPDPKSSFRTPLEMDGRSVPFGNHRHLGLPNGSANAMGVIHSGPQDRHREKRSFSMELQTDPFLEPSYKPQRDREHLRPLARSNGLHESSRHRPAHSQKEGRVSSKRTNVSQPLHYAWEINGLETSPPPELPKSMEHAGTGSYRRPVEHSRQERKLEGANGHRRGASMQEAAGRCGLSRSPKDAGMDPVLDEFLMGPPVPFGQNGHKVAGPNSERAAQKEKNGKQEGGDRPKVPSTSTEEVLGLLEALETDDLTAKRDAAEKLRALGKNSNSNRATIAAAGAIPVLLNLIDSTDATLQEHAITAVLNLSINDVNKTALTVAGAIPALVDVLANPWTSSTAKESAAATLFSLSVMDDCKVTIGDAGAIPHLVDLLRNGTARGRKDAVTALFNLSIFSGNKVRIIKAKAVPLLVSLVRDTAVREKCVAVLANLSTMKDGRAKIAEAGGIPALVDQVDVGTPRSKENSAATLLQLAVNSSRLTAVMIQAGAITPLLELSQNGTPRAREKALALIRHFRDVRKSDPGRSSHAAQGVGLV